MMHACTSKFVYLHAVQYIKPSHYFSLYIYTVGTRTNDSTHHISSTIAPPTAPPTSSSVSDSPESTYIPNSISRWKEESQALDGHTVHVCVGALRPLLLQRLKDDLQERDNKAKSEPQPSSSKIVEPKTSEASGTREEERPPSEQQVTAPNPSDEATPSTATPRNGSRSVEQLQSSLRAVADALAQTVAEMRNTDTVQTTSTSDIDPVLADIVNRHAQSHVTSISSHVTSSSSHVTSEPTTVSSHVTSGSSHVTSVSSSATPISSYPLLFGSPGHTVSSIPDLSSFDGSQVSARAMLSQINPSDPLYTFLSAVARGPTPPLPESQSEPANLSSVQPSPPPSLPSSSSASRLPVFTQLLPSNDQTTPTLPLFTSSTVSSSVSSDPPITTVSPLPLVASTSVLATSNFADVLARELSTHLNPIFNPPELASPPTTSSTSSDHLQPIVSSSIITVVPFLSATTAASTDSPSPSDTLAPLMSSLQMPPHSVPSQPTPITEEDTVAVVTESQQRGSAVYSSPSSSSELQSSSAGGSSLTVHSITWPVGSDESQSMQLDNSTPSVTSTTTNPQSTAVTSSSEIVPVSQASTGAVASSSSSDLPDGIDPTFLAALPDSIRQEVLAQYEREQQRNSRRGNTGGATPGAVGTTGSVQSINPEVLAALPPDIQEEVRDLLLCYIIFIIFVVVFISCYFIIFV